MSLHRLPIHHEQVHQPTKHLRTNALIRQAVNDGKPLPLQVLLEAMWELRDQSIRLAALPPGHDDHDPRLAVELRKMAVAVAEKAAPYCHPKLSNVAVRPEDEDEAAERRAANRLTSDVLKGKTVKELGELWLAVAKGDQKELDELTDQLPNPPDTDHDALIPDKPMATFEQAEAAQSKLASRRDLWDAGMNGISIGQAKDWNGNCLRVRFEHGPIPDLPTEIDGVPIYAEIVGRIEAYSTVGSPDPDAPV